MQDCIAALEEAQAEFSRGQIILPPRMYLTNPEIHGRMAIMPAVLKDTDAMGIKVQCTFFDNAAKGLPSVSGVVVLQDAHTGVPLAIMDSAYITAVRTAAASALATQYLARPAARVLATLGAGVQGRTHLWAIKTVRPIERVHIWSRTQSSAERYKVEMEAEHGLPVVVCATQEQAVRGAGVICTTSLAKTPISRGQMVAARGPRERCRITCA